jgi:5-methylcytosine-specific restriction protein A
MAGIILGWNPAIWDGWQPAYPQVVERIAEEGSFRARWSVGRRRKIEPGSEAWLLLWGCTPARARFGGPRRRAPG